MFSLNSIHYYPQHRSETVLFPAEFVRLKPLLFFRFDKIVMQLSRRDTYLMHFVIYS